MLASEYAHFVVYHIRDRQPKLKVWSESFIVHIINGIHVEEEISSLECNT